MADQMVQIQGSEYAPPPDVSSAMNSSNIEEIAEARSNVLARIRWLRSQVAQGNADKIPQGQKRLTVREDLLALYGQNNALNLRLAAFVRSKSIVPYDPTGNVARVWNVDGTLTDFTRQLLGRISDQQAQQVFLQALSAVGQFASTTTSLLTYQGEIKTRPLLDSLEERTFRSVIEILGSASESVSSPDPDKRNSRYSLVEDDIDIARKNKGWTPFNERNLKSLISRDKIYLVRPVPEGLSRLDNEIQELQTKIDAIVNDPNAKDEDLFLAQRYQKDLLAKQRQKGK